MQSLLTESQIARYTEFKGFVALNVEPSVRAWDREQNIPDTLISLLARAGYLGTNVPLKYGGQGWDTVTFGLLNEAIGRSSSALADLLTVQAMVSMTLLKWGTNEQKVRWVPSLAGGETIGAFALTEPGGGSDLRSLQTELKWKEGRHAFLLSGQKTWISYGQSAGLFLVFGMLEQQPVACLVPRETDGLEVKPIDGMMGFRAAGLAQIHFNEVEVPAANMIGKPGVALSYIAPIGLQYGRISTACSALGLLRGCFEESTSYAASRRIGSGTAGDLGMIRSMVAKMGTDLHAASCLCHNACRAEDDHLPQAFTKTLMAKYFTSRAAARAASDAVQILGAAGCHEGSPVSRYYRDAKIMEIIEGTSQIHEDILGKSFVDASPRARPAALR
jgi:alkylation response protein AidB-like acyl-CoA dehydrogenase